MNTQPTAKQFFEIWCETAGRHIEKLTNLWNRPTDYTKLILSHQNGLIKEIASRLQLQSYSYGRSGYYWMDAVLFSEADVISGRAKEEIWLRKIRVAVEHENDFQSGLFKEIGHLLITNCSLRVLITYPRKRGDWQELDNLHAIISGTEDAETISRNSSFLIIFGWKAKGDRILWEGYTFALDGWSPLHKSGIFDSNGT